MEDKVGGEHPNGYNLSHFFQFGTVFALYKENDKI